MTESAADPLTTKLPAGFDVLADDVALAAEVADALTEVEEDLLGSLASADELVNASSRYLAQAGGKRVRPLLTVLTSMLGDGVDARVRRAAAVMEMTHLATLYHDDVMDSAPVRRGAPAAHQVWGNSIAILTGDLILARASRMMSELGLEASMIQAETFERLVMGQLHETVGPQDGEDAYAHYLGVIGDKTGSLVAAASRLGAHFGGCSEQTIAMLQDYGEAVGVAFQLADDVIDLTADSETSGKTPGTDLREAVATLPVLLLRQQAETGSSAQVRQDAVELLSMVDGDLSSDETLAQTVAALVAHPVTEQSWQVAHSWAERAKDSIAGLPESTVKSALVAFADAVVEREG